MAHGFPFVIFQTVTLLIRSAKGCFNKICEI
jgi:hypothetical protein